MVDDEEVHSTGSVIVRDEQVQYAAATDTLRASAQSMQQ